MRLLKLIFGVAVIVCLVAGFWAGDTISASGDGEVSSWDQGEVSKYPGEEVLRALLFSGARKVMAGDDWSGVISSMPGDEFSGEIYPAVRFLAAEMHYRAGQYQKAARNYEFSLEHCHASTCRDDAAFAFITAMEARGNDRDASEEWEDWLDRFQESPLFPEAMLARAWNALRRDGGKEGEEILDELISRYPWMENDNRVSLARSIILYSNSKYRKALALLEEPPAGDFEECRAGDFMPSPRRGNGPGIYPLNISLSQDREIRDFMSVKADVFPQIRRGMNTTAAGHYIRALCRIELGDEFAAAVELSRLVDHYPRHPLAGYAWYIKGTIFDSRDDFARAAGCFGKLTERMTREDMVRKAELMKAVSLLQGGSEQESCKLLRDFVSRHEDSPLASRAQFMLGEAMWRREEYREAIAEFNRYISGFYDHYLVPAALYRVGRCLDALGRPHQAVSTYASIVSGYPLSGVAPAAAYLAGVNILEQGRFQQAASCFQFVLDRYGDHRGGGRFVFDTPAASELMDASICLMAYSFYCSGDTGQLTGTVHHILENMDPGDSIWRACAMLIDSHALASRGHFKKAGNRLERIASRYPDHHLGMTAKRLKAWICSEQGELARALDIERKIAGRYRAMDNREGLASTLISIARLHFNNRDYGKAMERYREFLRLFPRDERIPTVKYQSGICYLRMGRGGDAADMWQSVVEDTTAGRLAEAAWIRAGDVYFQAHQYERAKQCYLGLLENFPRSDAAEAGMLRIAQCEYNSGNTLQALKEFKELARRYRHFPGYPQAVKGIIRSLYVLGVKGDSLDALGELVENYPNSSLASHAQHKIAMKWYRQGQYRKAAEAFRKLMSDYPDYRDGGSVILYMADSYLNSGHREKAREAYRKVVDYFPHSDYASRARFHLASLLYQEGRYSGAISGFEELLAKGPADDIHLAALYNLAMCHQITGHPEEACKALEAYRDGQKKGDPRSSMVAYHLGKIYRALGRAARAAREFERALREGPPEESRLEILYLFGRCMEKMGETGEAIAAYRKSFKSEAKRNSFRLSALARYAVLFEQKGDYRTAIEAYRDIIRHARNPEVIVAAKKEVSRLETAMR